MESKPKTSTGAIREKWTNYEKQTGVQYLVVAGSGGKPDRRWRFRFRFRGTLYSEVLGLESNGLSEKKIMALWAEYAANRALGNEPFSPGGAVDLQEAARETAAREADEARSHAIVGLFAESMQPCEVTAKAGHIQRYTRLFENWIAPVVGDLPIHEMKAVHVAQIIKAMQIGKVLRTLAPEEKHRYKEKPRSAQTQAHAWNALRVVWTYARDNRLVMGAFPGAKLKPKTSNARVPT